MTAPLARRKQLTVLRLFFEGLSYDQIAHHAGVAKGSVEEIIRRLKAGEYEEVQDVSDIVDILREIAVYVQKHFAGDLDRAHVGSLAWVSLNRLGVDPAKVPEWARMCEDLATSDVPVQKFLEIALWCWGLAKELGVRLLDLPQHLESLKGEVGSLRAQQETLASEAQAAKATLASLREEVGLLQDVKGLRSAKKDEESRFTEAQSRTQAALAAAQITSEGLEQFRVFAGTAKAKGVPVDGGLFDVLLTLVASVGPNGIRDADTLMRLLAKEKMCAADGADLLTGLWGLGFTLSQAAAVARALGNEGSFADALNHLVSLLHQYGSLQTAVADATRRRDGLSRQEAAQRTESENLERHLGMGRNDLAKVTRQVKQASDERDRIQAETQRIVADGKAQLQNGAEELHRVEGACDGHYEELVNLLTPEDFLHLAVLRQVKKSGAASAPSDNTTRWMAKWITDLMRGETRVLEKPHRGPDGQLPRGGRGTVLVDKMRVALSRADRELLAHLIAQASHGAEGPFHAIVRILCEKENGERVPADTGDPNENRRAFQEFERRHDAIFEFLRVIDEVLEGKRGESLLLPP